MNRCRGLWIVIMLGCSGFSASAQESFEEWKKQDQQAFQQFFSEEDRQFTQFLEREWEEYQALDAMVRDPAPKPQEIPEAPVRDETPERDEPPVKVEPEAPASDIPPVPEKPSIPHSSSRPPFPAARTVKITFFSRALPIAYEKTISLDASPPFDKDTFHDAWIAMAKWSPEILLENLRAYRKKLELNDWGYFLLVNKTAAHFARKEPNKRAILTWYLLIESGYNCRICYTGSSVYLMLPITNRLYSVPYFSFTSSGPMFYLFRNSEPAASISSFYTYQGEYPGEVGDLQMLVTALPRLSDTLIQKTVSFQFRGKPYEIAYELNESMITFGKLHPQTEIPVYFGAPVSEAAKTSLLSQLRPIIATMDEKAAVDLLLRFVQTGFDYKRDDQQFGREKPMFAEETLYYPYSDCEDRSVLFAYLVEELLGLEVIGLEYPGHIATAVRFSGFVDGDSVKVDGKRFVICDPTYINATAGMSMPCCKRKTPKVMDISR